MSLKDELTNDPLTRGYAGMTDAQVADNMNNILDRNVGRETVSGSEIFNAIDDGEYGSLTAEQKTVVREVCAIDQINTNNGVARSDLLTIFTAVNAVGITYTST